MFDHAELEETVPWRLRQRSQPKWQNIHVLDANLAIFGSPSLSQSLGYTFIELFVAENPKFSVGLSTLRRWHAAINIVLKNKFITRILLFTKTVLITVSLKVTKNLRTGPMGASSTLVRPYHVSCLSVLSLLPCLWWIKIIIIISSRLSARRLQYSSLSVDRSSCNRKSAISSSLCPSRRRWMLSEMTVDGA